jgi:hypothetical protein
VYATSSKQKLVSKSSTEAELIGVSDALSQVIWTRDFLLEQGYKVDSAKLMQDNLSTMALANRGWSNSSRTRHVGIRFFFIKDRIDSGEIEVEHLGSESMVADILTKPLQGELFRKLRKLLLNWDDQESSASAGVCSERVASVSNEVMKNAKDVMEEMVFVELQGNVARELQGNVASDV